MATDHRGRDLHAGKRTYDMMRQARWYGNPPNPDPLANKTWDATNPETQKAYHSAVDSLERSRTARFFDHMRSSATDTGSAFNLMVNSFEHPDSAHVSLSNETYR